MRAFVTPPKRHDSLRTQEVLKLRTPPKNTCQRDGTREGSQVSLRGRQSVTRNLEKLACGVLSPYGGSFPLDMSREHALQTKFLRRDALWSADRRDQRKVREALAIPPKGNR
jgi:hypothetical protein